MKQRAIPALGRVLPGLGARLLSELTRSGAPPADRDAQPPPPAATPGDFIALYRDAIERLEAQVARGDGHPPMRKREVDLMCRCLLSCATLADAIRCAREFGEMLTRAPARCRSPCVTGARRSGWIRCAAPAARPRASST